MVWFNNIEISSSSYTSSSPTFKFCRLWGLAPYIIRKNERNFILKLSLGWIIYSYMLGLFLVYTSLHALVVHMKNNIAVKGEYVLYFSSVLGNVVTIVLEFGAPLRTEKLYSYIKCINKFDALLEIKDSKRARYVSIGSLSILYAVVTTQVCVSMYFMGVRNIVYVLTFLPDNIQQTFMATAFECQYAHMVYCVQRRIGIINDFFKLNDDSGIQKQTTKRYFRSSNKRVGRLDNKLQTQYGSDYGLLLAKLYSLLCDAVDSINKLFAYTIVILIMNCLIRLTQSLYFLIFMILQKYPLGSIVTQGFWVAFDWLRLLILVQPCSRCLTQINNTSVTVSKIHAVTSMNNKYFNLKEQMRIFSRHLQNRKLEFSIGGFATLNYKFLTAFMSAVTTYLVIIIQFNQSFNRS